MTTAFRYPDYSFPFPRSVSPTEGYRISANKSDPLAGCIDVRTHAGQGLLDVHNALDAQLAGAEGCRACHEDRAVLANDDGPADFLCRVLPG